MAEITGKKIGATGYGLMGLTWRANPCSTEQAFSAMKTALAAGANLFNGGEFYGPPERNSLQLINEYFTKFPEDKEKVVLSIKGGIDPKKHAPDGSREGIDRSMGECLRLLDGKKFLDVFECARVDPNTPVEETISYLGQYVKDGKLGGISLSECSASTIRKAAKVHKIEFVEVEFSMFSTDIISNGVAEACAELTIPILAYSPLGRGFLTGQLKSLDDIPKDDMRRNMPRFQPGAFENNLKLVKEVEKVASKKGCTPGQVALAWVKAHSGKNGMPVIIPIPGATTDARIEENMKDVALMEEDLKELDDIVKRCTVQGDRYGGPLAKLMWG